jgi:DNA-binding CsgD family transcriptional regulator
VTTANLFAVLRELQDTSDSPWIAFHADWTVASANRAFEALVGVKSRRLVNTKPPYTFWDGSGRDNLVKSNQARAATFVDANDSSLRVMLRGLPVRTSAKARPDGYVVRVTAPAASGRALDVEARERLRVLETTLARVRHEIGLVAEVGAPGVDPEMRDALQLLSARERQVVDSLLRGERVTQVAANMGIAPNTVRNHIKAVFRKLGVRSQTEMFVKLRFLIEDRESGN